MVKKNNRNGQLLIRFPRTKPSKLPKALQVHRARLMYSSIKKRQRIEVTTEKSSRSAMSMKDKAELIKRHGKDDFLELPHIVYD